MLLNLSHSFLFKMAEKSPRLRVLSLSNQKLHESVLKLIGQRHLWSQLSFVCVSNTLVGDEALAAFLEPVIHSKKKEITLHSLSEQNEDHPPYLPELLPLNRQNARIPFQSMLQDSHLPGPLRLF